MFDAIADFISEQQDDSAEFVAKARALAIGVARYYEPKRIYLIRIDNWFGPRWMHFAGKALGLVGVHPVNPLHVPPFVPHRVLAERVFAGPGYDEAVVTPPLHIECPSSRALHRRIADIDKDAAFVWFSGESEKQKRGAVMVYLPVVPASTKHRKLGLGHSGAFYVGFSRPKRDWEPSMLRGVSHGEVAHLQESGRVLVSAVT